MKTGLCLLTVILASVTGSPVQTQDVIPTQENFDVNGVFGKWYDIAMGSTCKWLKYYKDKYNSDTLELSEGPAEDEIQALSTWMRGGTCMQVSDTYQMTDVPGKFKYISEKYGAEVVYYVVFTNYNEYALLLMRKTMRGQTTTTVRLYGRTPELRQSLIDDFRQFALEQGIADDSIFVLQNKGECIPGDIEVTHRRSQRAAANDAEEGSGDESPFTNNRAGSCHLPPAAGPCLGTLNRYFYNSSSMACETFKYGGCLGNLNNFDEERDCLQTCRTEAVCRLPVVRGPCRASLPRWAFDASQEKCVTFLYGGCGGNGNHFYTEKECKEYCGVPTNDEEEFLDARN